MVAMTAVVLERFLAVAGDLHLWGDGAWMFIRIASTRNFYFWVGDWKARLFQSRFFTILLEQTPLVIATHLRIHSLHLLSVIYGATLYSHALLSLFLCYHYTRRRWFILFPLLSFFAGPMNVEAYLSTDSHLLVSLYWPALFILLFCDEIEGWTLLLLLALSLPMLIAYESMVFFGLVLAGVCLWRFTRFPRQRKLAAGLAIWYLAGAAIAVISILRPFDPTNRNGFLHGLNYLLHSSHITAKISILILVCSCTTLALPARLAATRTVVTAAGLLAVAYLCFQVLLGRTPTSLEEEVAARTLNLLAPLIATSMLFLVAFQWLRPQRKAIGLAALLVGSLGLGQAVWNLAALGDWQAYLATLRYDLALHEGPVPIADSVLSQVKLGPLPLKHLEMSWALLPLSLYETGQGQVRSIITPEDDNYFPFDPYAPEGLPDLSRYRIYYDSYRQVLQRNWKYRIGQTLGFQRGGSAIRYMRGDWAAPEDWATWGTGPEFGVDLPLDDQRLPDTVTLWALVTPNLTPNFPTLSTQVFVNDAPIETWTFNYLPDPFQTRTATIPRSALLLSNPVRIRFRIVGPLHSPAEMGKGADPRKLGLALVKMRLQDEK